jgi:hypothetical protein
MPSEFALNVEEFEADLDAIVDVASLAGSSTGEGGRPRSRVAAGNASVLLMAALFEEHIRQQVKLAYRLKSEVAAGMDDFPRTLPAVVWGRTMEVLRRTRFDDHDWPRVEARLSSLVTFCIRRELSADVTDIVAHNSNNMAPRQLKDLFKEIGVQSVLEKVCTDESLVQFLGSASSGAAVTELESRLKEFFKRRNEIAHAISLHSSSGPAELAQDIELFRAFSGALARILEAELTQPPP